MPFLSIPVSWKIPGRCSLLLALPLLFPLLRLDCVVRPISAVFRVITSLKLDADALRKLLPHPFQKSIHYKTYQTRSQEDDYWASAEVGQRELSFSDARYARRSFDELLHAQEGQILYYTPRLLPEYRDKRSTKGSSDVSLTIPARAFVKWHWLVFPDRVRYADNSVVDTDLTDGIASNIRAYCKLHESCNGSVLPICARFIVSRNWPVAQKSIGQGINTVSSVLIPYKLTGTQGIMIEVHRRNPTASIQRNGEHGSRTESLKSLSALKRPDNVVEIDFLIGGTSQGGLIDAA